MHALRDFSHPDTESKEPTDLNRTIESATVLSRNAWRYVAELEPDLAPDLPPVHAVAGQLTRVFVNLLTNAAHAIAAKGDEQPGRIRITTRRDGDRVEVRISDTGTGIPEHVRARVFEPFFTTKDVGEGTGQGLAIAHNVIVERHGGAISCETRPGEGTTFIVQLPISGAMGERRSFDGMEIAA